MKRCYPFLVLLLLFSTTSLAEGKYISWFDGTHKLRKRIDIEHRTLQAEYAPGKWQDMKKVQFDSLANKHLPPRISAHAFYLNDGKWRFTLAGTGIVFDFDENQGTLTKADRTYFSGYNFGASVFLRQDTLYSFGGSGFWNYSKALTYFDPSSAEWENLKAQNLGPASIFNGFHGYHAPSDLFYSGGSEYHNFLNNEPTAIDQQFYQFDFKSKRWELLGKILPQLFQTKSREVIWSGRYFVQFSDEAIYFIDPVANQVYKYPSENRFFQAAPQMYVHNDTIYGYWDEEGGKLTSLNIIDLVKKSEPIGKFYSPNSYWAFYLLGAFLLVFSVLIFNYLRKRDKKRNLHLDEQELNLVKALLAAESKGLSTVEVNDLLGLSAKNLDNQRRLRLNIIANINHKLYLKYRIEHAITRTPSTLDKRQSLYLLQNDVLRPLKEVI